MDFSEFITLTRSLYDTATYIMIPSTANPTCAKEKALGKCDLPGCRPGTTSNYCFAGKHFCEDE